MRLSINPVMIEQARAIAANLKPITRPTTIAELADLYLEAHVGRYYRKNGQPTSATHAAKAAIARLTAVASELHPMAMDVMKLEHARQVMVLQGLNRETINKYIGIIVMMFDWGAVREFCDRDLPARLRLLRPIKSGREPNVRETEERKPVPTPVLKATLRGLIRVTRDPSHRYRSQAATLLAMITLQLRAGMRPGELCSMTWRELDMERQDVWLYTPGVHKSQHHDIDRFIWLGPASQRIILQRATEPSGYRVFPISRNGYRQKLRRWLNRLGLPMWTPHQLRHNFATRIDRCADEKAAQRLLGHTQIKTTRGYIDPDMRRAIDIIRRFG